MQFTMQHKNMLFIKTELKLLWILFSRNANEVFKLHNVLVCIKNMIIIFFYEKI